MPLSKAAELALLAHASGGSVAEWCAKHPDTSGCPSSKRAAVVLNSASAPKMRVTEAYNFDQCHDQLGRTGTHVDSSIPSPGEARFDGVPPACMDLAAVLTSSCAGDDGLGVANCGSACLKYTGLTDVQFAALSNALLGLGGTTTV
ncbi:hypothetical protein F5Y17DRAFT_463212 [Xylariaceae sp. FL0594]|nr:hypothetical protein F5Y17DRAFT_463212 [Xylariaceae sp. FL0594]